jgi:SAM-dependent methyltransferase
VAIPIQTAALWADEIRRRPWSGSILQLGRQSMFFDRPTFAAFCDHRSLRAASVNNGEPVDDQQFFGQLGFQTVESLDVTPDEHPTHVCDLNQPLPDALAEKYDCVFDGGTLEHVFDIATGLRSMARAVRVGGRAVHMAVTSNYIDHGFYQLSPTLLWDFYAANGFEIERALLVELLVSGAVEFLHPWRVYRYTLGSCDHFNLGAWGFSPRPVAFWFIARKTESRSQIVNPHQSLYSRWATAESASGPGPRPSSAKTWLKRHARWAYLPLVDFRRWWHTPRPPLVGTIDAEGRIHRRVGWDG